MALKVRQQLVPIANRYQGNGTNTRRYLTIHQTDNFSRGANAAAHANLQAGGYKGAAWHWQVDDKEAVQSYPETAIAWHAGDGGTGPGNRESIAIEMCVNSDSNYEATFDNAAQLAAQILNRNTIPISRMVQHNHWTGKDCPSQIRKRQEWSRFVALVTQYLEAAVDTGSTSKLPDTTTTTPQEGQEEEEEMKTTGLAWTSKDGKPMYALVCPASGFFSVWTTAASGTYNNPIARGFDTGSFVKVTESHAKALAASCALVRGDRTSVDVTLAAGIGE